MTRILIESRYINQKLVALDKEDSKVFLEQSTILRPDETTSGRDDTEQRLTNDIRSHTQSLAENLGLLHTKKEHVEHSLDFEHVIAPILMIGQDV